MSEFQGTYVCKKHYDLKPIGANWEFVKHKSSSTNKLRVSEYDMKALKDGKNPYVHFYCSNCNGYHSIPLNEISVEELEGGDTSERAIGDV